MEKSIHRCGESLLCWQQQPHTLKRSCRQPQRKCHRYHTGAFALCSALHKPQQSAVLYCIHSISFIILFICEIITYNNNFVIMLVTVLPSVLWHCWLSIRKSIRPVKNSVMRRLSVWSKVQIICIWSSWCQCHPIICCFIKTQNGFLPY